MGVERAGFPDGGYASLPVLVFPIRQDASAAQQVRVVAMRGHRSDGEEQNKPPVVGPQEAGSPTTSVWHEAACLGTGCIAESGYLRHVACHRSYGQHPRGRESQLRTPRITPVTRCRERTSGFSSPGRRVQQVQRLLRPKGRICGKRRRVVVSAYTGNVMSPSHYVITTMRC